MENIVKFPRTKPKRNYALMLKPCYYVKRTHAPETLEKEWLILKLHAEKIQEPVEGLETVTNPGWIIQAQNYVASKIKASEQTLDKLNKLPY